jgi:DNA invertase Pin-like site-specific DNA recombinase
MSLFGYARVSTTEQDLSIQIDALRVAGCQTIRSEKKSGAERGTRTELQILMDFLREGDTLVVTRIDRLARSMKDLQDIVHELKGRGVALKATEQPIDTGTAAGKAFLDMLGVFAEFETNLRRERQAEGIAAAKARGVYKGGKARIDPEAVRSLATAGVKPAHIARQLGISRGTVYRFLPAANDRVAGLQAITGSVGNAGSTENNDIAYKMTNDANTTAAPNAAER